MIDKFQGFTFGLIDAFIVALFAFLGISLESHFTFLGEYGAVYGALFGHMLSNTFAGYFDFGLRVALNMGLGCLIILTAVHVYLSLTEFK